MREVFIGVALAASAALVVPAFAQSDDQTKTNGTTEQYEPGTGGQSKAGPGLPSNKSGAAQENNSDDSSTAGAGSGEEGSGNAAGSDNGKVPGLPGNKSGPSDKMAPSDDNSGTDNTMSK